jgi:hypothetical protein
LVAEKASPKFAEWITFFSVWIPTLKRARTGPRLGERWRAIRGLSGGYIDDYRRKLFGQLDKVHQGPARAFARLTHGGRDNRQTYCEEKRYTDRGK